MLDVKTLKVERTTKPIVGWRAWQTLHPHYLSDANKHTIWAAGEKMEAFCYYKKDHFAPVFDCTCGIYAFKEKAPVLAEFRYSDLIGQVSLWGNILETELGYKAQYAYPLTFEYDPTVVVDSCMADLDYIAYRYGLKLERVLRSPLNFTIPDELQQTICDSFNPSLMRSLRLAMKERAELGLRALIASIDQEGIKFELLKIFCRVEVGLKL